LHTIPHYRALFFAQNYQNWLISVEDSKLKHRHFRDTVYSIAERAISGLHVSTGNAQTLVRRGRI